jgi:hypothetical protein
MQPITAQPHPVRGRWIWRLVGIAVVLVLIVALFKGFAGTYDSGAETVHPVPARTVTVTQPVTGLNVTSYGGAIQVAQGKGDEVTVTEQMNYSSPGSPPRVSATVSDGLLTLAAPACANENCFVGFTITVPRSVAVTAQSGGGPISVSGATEASLDSDGGPVTAQDIQGSLSVTAESGSITASGAGSAYLDSYGGPVTVGGIRGTLNVASEGGSVDVRGAGSTTIDSGGGPVSAASIRGFLTVTSDGGSIEATGAESASLTSGGGPIAAHAINGTLTADTNGGSLLIGDLAGPLTADTGGGPVEASGLASTTAKVNTDGGSAWLGFTSEPLSVQLITAGGDGVLVLPGGPYLVNADSAGGPQTVTVPVSPTSGHVITISTSDGQLQVKPGS